MGKGMNILITGGAGFIGINTAIYFLEKGHKVHILDNLSRKNVYKNLRLLEAFPEEQFCIHIGDIRDENLLYELFQQHSFDGIIHLAAQVTVTQSILEPIKDFQINVGGTLNILETQRKLNKRIPIIFASTNKVYEPLSASHLQKEKNQYISKETDTQTISENFQLTSNSPYSCSKGTAERYLKLYWDYYQIPCVILRQSCIYGLHQMGYEEQGWVAWFAICAVIGNSINIYGDGCQVRDVLFISDLVDLYHKIFDHIEQIHGEIFNIGGGASNAISLLQLIDKLQIMTNRSIALDFHNLRAGDQLYYVSDISKIEKKLEWQPKIDLEIGVRKLLNWVEEKYGN